MSTLSWLLIISPRSSTEGTEKQKLRRTTKQNINRCVTRSVTHLICLQGLALHVKVPDFGSQVVSGEQVATAMAKLYIWHWRDDLREEGASAGILRLLKHWGGEGDKEEGNTHEHSEVCTVEVLISCCMLTVPSRFWNKYNEIKKRILVMQIVKTRSLMHGFPQTQFVVLSIFYCSYSPVSFVKLMGNLPSQLQTEQESWETKNL